ncbi:histidine kinase [Pantoea sp. Cy-639]|uniref:histidine kinase n=1 Tax=Pantoea sp. Cy-639 TaxID=2608360 RepID=UPI001423A3D4|nr:histidine kinase [Pantoea sp. Cy-639]NIF16215.1 histidine kinase [Pantoea sp. Cy-639]
MHQLQILIQQPRSSHQILLHQAFNAQGVFNVRVVEDVRHTLVRLERRTVDVLVLDCDAVLVSARSLFASLRQQIWAKALLFVGRGNDQVCNLASEARRHGLWVLAELSWPLSSVELQQALGQLSRTGRRRQTRETVM